MRDNKKFRSIDIRSRQPFILGMIVIIFAGILFLKQGVTVRARQLDDSGWEAAISPSSPAGMSLFEAPVAEGDSGEGFTTKKNQILYTANILANDSDADGDGLFVHAIDTTNTIGSLKRRDGVPDLSFGQEGKVITSVDKLDYPADLALQPDGKVLLAATYETSDTTRGDFAIVRYNLDGSLDTSFDEDGIAVTDFGWTDLAIAVVVQPDGRIIAAGPVFENKLGIARYNADGSPDLSFGEGGKITTTDINVQIGGLMGLVLQSDGKIVAAGSCFIPDIGYAILVARFNPDGSLDSTFDEDGIVQTAAGTFTLGYDVVIQPDGKILVSGYGSDHITGESGFVLVRYNPDGSLDDSFDGDGIVLTGSFYDSQGGRGIAVALQPDNKIVTLGNTWFNSALVRYNPDGSLDTTFGDGGIVLTNLVMGYDFVIQPNGTIVVTGSAGDHDIGFYMVALRLLPDGSLDTSFGDAGLAWIDLEDGNGSAIAMGTRGIITLAGNSGGGIALARVFGDGTFTYNPNHQFDYLKLGEQAEDVLTYVVSDGILTDTAGVTITVLGSLDYAFLPVIPTPPKGIYGWVRDNGIPAEGTYLQLRFFNGTNWSTVASTTTDSNGKYSFDDVPALLPGQVYYVLYSNTGEPNHLWMWGTRDLTGYSQDDSVIIGNFDIANIQLVAPDANDEVGLPHTFRWAPRLASPSDSYEFNLFDPYDEEPYFWTDPTLGYVDNYTLSKLPPGFVSGEWYVWDMWVYGPDGGFGISYEARWVSFADAVLSSIEALQTIESKSAPNLEYLRYRSDR